MEHGSIPVTEVAARGILQKSKFGFGDYTLNPYAGCAFGCSFCYVPSLRKFRGQEWDTWGQWVEAKTNAAALLRRELIKVQPDAKIMIGTATDAWQPAEKRFGVMRSILEVLAEYPNPVSIVTRSPLILRDIPLLQKMTSHGGVHIGFSLSTFDDRARAVFEPRSPRVGAREHVVRTLLAAGIRVSLFWAPLLPGVSDNAIAVREYMERAGGLGVKRVMCGLLNYRETMGPGYAQRLCAYYARCANSGDSPASRVVLNRAALQREVALQAELQGIECNPSFG